MAKTRKIPLRKSVVSNEVIDKRDLPALSKTKKVKFSLIQQARRTDVELISNLIMKKRFKLSKNESLIAVLIWKWKKIFTMS